APEAARAEYARMVAAGIHGDTHEHVYGANLVVRLDAYLEVGGFERLDHGEDHRLVQRLREAGHRVATPLAPVVRTSGRITPRCPDGLGALLARLSRG
ncbi:MAG: glycosyltransferase family 2 protein, partial [bacterium]|nr:glycosyltransferase family 2 protein [bacterium]